MIVSTPRWGIFVVNLKYVKNEGNCMDLGPRQAAFVKSEMEKIERDETRQPTEKIEAGRIRETVEKSLTE